MGKCIIIAPLYAGEEQTWLRKESGDLLICADGGYAAAVRYGMRPDLTIGDFDSMPEDQVQGDKLVLPVHKDDTDMIVCINEGRKRGYSEFRIAGCLGGRLDHTLANMQVLIDAAMRGEQVWMCDGQNRATALAPGEYHYHRDELPGWKLSLLAATERVRGLTVKGCEWELDNAELSQRYPLGVSNEVRGDVTIRFEEGILFLLRSTDRREK